MKELFIIRDWDTRIVFRADMKDVSAINISETSVLVIMKDRHSEEWSFQNDEEDTYSLKIE